MKRIVGTMFAAAMLAACGTAPGGVTDPVDPIDPPGGGPAAKPAWALLGDAPAPRAGHMAVYDAARDRMLVFGGGANDLWAQPFSGPNAGGWQRIEAGGDVPPPVETVAVIDEGTQRLMVFPANSLERAWSLPLDHPGDWTLAGYGASPKIQLGFSLAADPAGRRLFAYTSGVPEAWVLPLDGGGIWTKLAGAPEVDGFGCRDDLVYDGAHSRLLVLSGGWPRGNVFALSLGATPAWSKLNTDEGWFDYGATMTYDAAAERFLATGPAPGNWMWSFAVNDTKPLWTHLKVGGTPPVNRWGASGVYDSKRHRMVIFGGAALDDGRSLHDDTWALSLDDAPAWSQVGSLDRVMPAGQGTSLAAAQGMGGVVRFGGVALSDAASSLRFDVASSTWSPLGDAPTARLGWSAGAWDPFGQRLVTFGGRDNLDEDQTWSLAAKATEWTQLDGSTHPSARSHHSMVLDPTGRRMLVFGGTESNAYPTVNNFDDVWSLALDGDPWTKLDVAGPGPSPRSAHAAAFDDAGRRMLIHGGTGADGALGDTWMLELQPAPHWVSLAPTGSAPPPLSDHFAAFDPASRRFLIVGNVAVKPPATADGVSVWALSTDGEPRWQRYCPKSTRPGLADGALWTERGLFITSQGSAWLFDTSSPPCG